MRYHYDISKDNPVIPVYGKVYSCNHPVYAECTLFLQNDIGLAVIQQYKSLAYFTYWGHIDPNLQNDIYLHPKFYEYFKEHAGKCDENGCYPTVTVRKLMWALRMKPLKKERWETVFDRKFV